MTRVWAHDELAIDLGAHLRAGGGQMTWLNIAVGGPGEPRPDVLAMTPWRYQSPGLVSYEVKVSMADFRSDVTSGKWMKYLAFSQGVTFAAPHGLLTVKDIPDGCGLILRSDRGWRHVRRPTLKPIAPISPAVWIKLVSTRPHTVMPKHGNAEDSSLRWYRDQAEREIKQRAMRKIGKRFGEDIARFLHAPETAREIVADARANARRIVEDAQARAEELKKDAEAGWRELAAALALPPKTSRYDIVSAVRRRTRLLSEAGAAAETAKVLGRLRDLLDEGTALQRMAAADTAASVPYADAAATAVLQAAASPHGILSGDAE